MSFLVIWATADSRANQLALARAETEKLNRLKVSNSLADIELCELIIAMASTLISSFKDNPAASNKSTANADSVTHEVIVVPVAP